MTDTKLPLLAWQDLLREVLFAHADPHSADYQECEKAPCHFCTSAKAALSASGGAEAVAWMVHDFMPGKVGFTTDQAAARLHKLNHAVTPLYSHPAEPSVPPPKDLGESKKNQQNSGPEFGASIVKPPLSPT
jgi:hypothetical protein